MWRDPGMEAVAKEQGFELSGTAGSRLDSDEMKKLKETKEKEKQENEEMDDKNSDIQAHVTSTYGPARGRGTLRGSHRGGYFSRGNRSRGRGYLRGRGTYQPGFQHHQIIQNQHYPPPVPLGYQQNVPPSPYGGPVRQTYQQQGYAAPY